MRIFYEIVDFLFPKRCLGCRRPGFFLCESCLSQLPLSTELSVHEPGWALDGMFVVAPYVKRSLLQACIKAMKYRHAPEMAAHLGAWMGAHLPRDVLFGAWLAPVPLHVRRERTRGYNQALLLARGLSARTGVSVIEPLVRHRFTNPQAGMRRGARLKNLSQCFSVLPDSPVVNKKIVLIDDVASTGSTLDECAKVLKIAGAREVWGCVLARG